MMTRAMLLLWLLGPIVLAQKPSPPFPNHEQPPPGWFCSPTAAQPDHKCSCKRMDADDLCEGEPQEDTKCLVWCHKQHCRCPIACKHKET
jgi:hypothetical protein